jgi:hypothetical protein
MIWNVTLSFGKRGHGLADMRTLDPQDRFTLLLCPETFQAGLTRVRSFFVPRR